MKAKKRSNKERRKQQEDSVTALTSVVSSPATSSTVEECSGVAELKFPKTKGDVKVRKRKRASSFTCVKSPIRLSTSATKRPRTEKNATDVEDTGKPETGLENSVNTEQSSNSQSRLPCGRSSSDPLTEYLHRQMLQDPQFIIGIMDDHNKVLERNERRASLRNCPSRASVSANESTDCVEGSAEPTKVVAMLHRVQELRKANNELEDRIAILTAKRDQLLKINDITEDVCQSVVHQCPLQTGPMQEPFEDAQNPTEDPQKPSEGPPKPSEDLQTPSEGPQKPFEEDPQEPSEDPPRPSEDPQTPSKDHQKPSEDPPRPSEEPQAPTEDPQKPSEGPQKPSEDP